MMILHRFLRTSRSAVAITFAVALLPLVLLVGIAVDVTFVSEARTQAAFASQAAATQAIRIAAATYSLEVSNGTAPKAAALQAINSANIIGSQWFNANLGTYIRGNIASGPTTFTTYDGGTTGAVSTATPPNFTATVSSTSSYPPIFNPIFGKTQPWVYGSGAAATTQFSYAQILMMLDTSNSMLIGATTTDVQTVEENTVCIPPSYDGGSAGNWLIGNLNGAYAPTNTTGTYGTDYNFGPAVTGQGNSASDGTWLDFTGATTPNAINYSIKNATGTEPSATSNKTGTSPYQLNGTCSNGATPSTPCALACHTSNSTVAMGTGTFTNDLYGYVRYLGVTLRVDTLLSATEQAITDIEASESASNQVSVGIYQFNTDVKPIVMGTTGSDALPEATTNLPSALSAVQAVDFKHNSTETAIPAFIGGNYNFANNQEAVGSGGNTNLRLSMQNLLAGTITPATIPAGSTDKPLTTSGTGSTISTPIKFMFIITDGMEDEYSVNGANEAGNQYYNYRGDMTSLADNQEVNQPANVQTDGTCTALKRLHYTVYVLYVDYLPVSENNYYTVNNDGGGNSIVNKQTNNDFPALDSGGLTAYDIADAAPYATENASAAQITSDIENNVPTAEALAQCASSPSDFYAANSASEIQTALSVMLKSALASTIQLTN